MRILILIAMFFIVINTSRGIGIFDSSGIYIELPVVSKAYKYSQRIMYESKIDTTIQFRISSFYYTNQDSLHLYDLSFENIKIRKGAHYLDLPFSKALSTHKMHTGFFDIIRKFGLVPAGRYGTKLELYSAKENGLLLQRCLFEQYADSVLSHSAGLRDKMNAAVASPKAAKQKVQQKRTKTSGKEQQVHAAQKKLNRNLRKVRGLDMREVQLEGKTYSEAWYEGFFLGRYELASVAELNERAEQESKALHGQSSSLVSNELEGFRGVGTQFRELNTKKDKETKVKGILDISSSRANAQDPQSVID